MRTPRSPRASAVAALAASATLALAPAAAAAPASAPPTAAASAAADDDHFAWVEATMSEVSTALATGDLTCVELVDGYLDRIEAYDQQGPTLRSMITVSATALDEAKALDEAGASGPLHCAPIVLKDNVDAAGLPTTVGSVALADLNPPDDAFITAQLREAGAVILGKANLDAFAFGFGGYSEIGGQVGNAYDPAYGPGGSSAGTGAAVAASFALAGIGTDTGGSVRVPSSVGGLVGIRPSMRLLSQDGIVPLALFQDTAGPMCRTVEDCAVMLEVLAGFDGGATSGQYTLPQQRDDTGVLFDSAEDFWGAVGVDPTAYTAALDADGLDGARIGVVRALFGDDPEVLAVLEDALAAMEAAGAVIEDVTIPDLDVITGDYTSMSGYEFYDHLSGYLAALPEDAGNFPRTYEELALVVEERLQSTFASRAATGATRYENETYDKNTLERPGFVRPRLDAALDNETEEGVSLGEPFDTLLYPSVQSLPREGRAPNAGPNNRLSPYSGFPALSMPAGFTAATDERVALPVGMELLGREFDEPTLLRIAYGYQSAVAGTSLARQAPTTVPELERPDPVDAYLTCPGTTDVGFPDVDATSVHAGNIACGDALDLLQGLVDGRFAPERTLTRAQAATVIDRIATATGRPVDAEGRRFPDVPTGYEHADAIERLAGAGVINGFADGTFGPALPVTRGQLASLLVRYIEASTGVTLELGEPFPDVAADSELGVTLRKARAAGVFTGTDAGNAQPERRIRRDQAASLFVRSLGQLPLED